MINLVNPLGQATRNLSILRLIRLIRCENGIMLHKFTTKKANDCNSMRNAARRGFEAGMCVCVCPRMRLCELSGAHRRLISCAQCAQQQQKYPKNKKTKQRAMRGKIVATARAAIEITTTKLDKVEQTGVNNKTNQLSTQTKGAAASHNALQ